MFEGRIPFIAQILGMAAVALGVVAVFTEGRLRSVALLLLFLVSLALTVMASQRIAGAAREGPVSGGDYVPPAARFVKTIHFIATIVYNLGIAVVVLAAIVRLELVAIGFAEVFIASFPFVLGAYTLLLALAMRFRIEEQGGTYSDWYTRTHGIVLAVIATPIAVLAVALIVRPALSVGSLFLTERDLLVFILVGMLGVGTQLFLALRLPNLVDLVTQMVKGLSNTEDSEGTPPLVYMVIVSIVATVAIAWVLLQFDVVAGLANPFADARLTFIILILPLGLGIFFAISTIGIWRESKRGLYKEKMSPKTRTDILVYTISAAFGLLFAGMLIAVLNGRTHVGPIPIWDRAALDLTMLTIASTAGPIGFYVQREVKRIDEIETRLADFLSDMADSRRAGLPLATGLKNAAKTDYGSLSVEVEIMSRQVAWGVAFNAALERMSKRVPSALVKRAVTLIIEASHTGGSVADILKAASRDAYEIKSLEADRRVAMMTYLIVIYVVFFVFMVVIGILELKFIPQIAKAAASSSSSGGDSGFSLSSIDPAAMSQIYFNATMVQAMGNGIVGGILSEGRVMSGLRHVAIMAITGWAAFRFMIPAA